MKSIEFCLIYSNLQIRRSTEWGIVLLYHNLYSGWSFIDFAHYHPNRLLCSFLRTFEAD